MITNPFEELNQKLNNVENLLKEVLDLQTKEKPQTSEEYYTRNEVANMFKVQLSTVHAWTKTGKLKPFGIGSRVYFKKSDLENCLVPLND